jgi:hypothetical protein
VAAPFPPRCRACFTPVERLAAGGFGEVWVATQAGLDRRVAVKVLSAQVLTRPEDVQRFLAEAKLTASLAHPSIVVVHDHGCEDGVPWIAYELLAGPSLRARLESEGALPEADALEVAAQVAGALEAAHAAGIVHRDVKPDNVLGAGPGRVKLTDFGIAKWAGAEVKTATGVVLGTPVYLAPEAIKGDAVGPSADLYALGVMLHELLCGKPPFEDESVVMLMQRHLTVPPPDLREHGVRAPVAQLVKRLLAKDPADRPASGGEVRAALEALKSGADGTPPVASRPGRRGASAVTQPVSRARASVTVAMPAPRTAPRLAAAGIAVALALAAGAAWRGRAPVPSPTVAPIESATAAPPRVEPDPLEAQAHALEAELLHVPEEKLRAAELRALDMCALLAHRKAMKPSPLPPFIAFRALCGLANEVRDVHESLKNTLTPAAADMDKLARKFSRVIERLEAVGWLLMTRPGEVQHHTHFLAIIHQVVDSVNVQAVLDPTGRARKLAERWAREHPKSWIAADVEAGAARFADDPFREMVARERALELYEQDHMAARELPIGIYKAWTTTLMEVHRIQGRLLSPRAQLELVARYARLDRAKTWRSTEDFDERRTKFEAALANCELAGVTGRAVLARPDTPLPSWTEDSNFVAATLGPQKGDPGGNVPRRALRWCAALSHHARPLPAELASLPVEQAQADVVDFIKRVGKAPDEAVLANPDELRRTHAVMFRMLDALMPVLLDRPAPVHLQAELAMSLRFHIKNERIKVLDTDGYAAGLVARWRERWKGRWLAGLLAPRRTIIDNHRDQAAQWLEAIAGLEREYADHPEAGARWLKYWALMAAHAAASFAKVGLTVAVHDLLVRLDALEKRHAAVIAADDHVRSILVMVRGELRARLGAAAPLPAPSPTSILGASDDPTPRRDRPGLQEVR